MTESSSPFHRTLEVSSRAPGTLRTLLVHPGTVVDPLDKDGLCRRVEQGEQPVVTNP